MLNIHALYCACYFNALSLLAEGDLMYEEASNDELNRYGRQCHRSQLRKASINQQCFIIKLQIEK